jgi:hypothetical protein
MKQPMMQEQPEEEAAEYASSSVGMSMSDAMDVLDQFHIKRGDTQKVMQAIEMVYGEEKETPSEQKGEPDGPMMKQIFSTDRKR